MTIDNSVYRMFNMVNRTGMEEIKLFIEAVRVKQQVNHSMAVGLVAVQYQILTDVEYMKMMKTTNMKKLIINLMKMLMMNLMET